MLIDSKPANFCQALVLKVVPRFVFVVKILLRFCNEPIKTEVDIDSYHLGGISLAEGTAKHSDWLMCVVRNLLAQ